MKMYETVLTLRMEEKITKRSAISSLLSTDLEIGEILYENNIGKDMVV